MEQKYKLVVIIQAVFLHVACSIVFAIIIYLKLYYLLETAVIFFYKSKM